MTQNTTGGAPSGASRGQPSQGLAESGLVDGQVAGGGGEYETITDAAAEAGIFTLIGGYLDDDGNLHREVHMRSMSGDEEDLLGNRGIHILERMGTILSTCIVRLGTITDRGQIAQAVHRMPLGTRTHALVCLRRVTHWKRTKDIYEMDVRCPIRGCEKVGSHAINLAELDTHDMPEPEQRVYELKLRDSGHIVSWRVATSAQERMLEAASDMEESRILTFAIMVRLDQIDGVDVRVGIGDVLTADKKKIKLSAKAANLFNRVRAWTVGDREDLREDIMDKEPSLDTEIDFECDHCHKPFKGGLDIGQESFFFPSATSRRSKTKSST